MNFNKSQAVVQRIQTNYSQIDLKILRKNDNIEVVDGCWRGNVSVTTLEMSVTVLAILITNIHYFFYISIRHQHSKGATNIPVIEY